MEIIFMITFLIIVAWIALLLKLINMDKEKAKRIKEEGILYESHLIHLGGHPYLSQEEPILLQIRNNNTVRFYKENTNTGGEIPINQITRYEIKTESEIQKDVTLTRLLALGIFAFGLKKKTEINNSYLILSYVQNNVPIDCIFKNAINNQQLGNIISTLNRLKIEQNSVQNN
jgi:hypothetical protein